MPYVPLTWLRETVDVAPEATPEDIAAALVKVGLEDEGIDGPTVTGPLVVGRVLSLVKEEQSNGKTINYCRVDVGSHNDPAGPGHKPDDGQEYPASRGIVCGAHNFVEGDYVVVSLPGTVLPGPFPIAGRKTYGHWSDGMICSVKELALGEDADGILVLASPSGESADAGYDVAELSPGQDAVALLGLDEVSLEINITPDRGYCFSMRGVAREYSHATGGEFRDPAAIEVTGTATDGSGPDAFEVVLEDEAPIRGNAGCDRFVARVLRGFDPSAPSPAWMQSRLRLSGMRPISLAVDVTNYVMLELGHPLHAYDLATLTAPIVVRRAGLDSKTGQREKLTTLDDAERALDPEDILVCDSKGGRGKRAIGMGGVMGGLETEISDSTTDILLEAAHWDPVTIARTARRHKLGSEASKRYERGVDPQLPAVAVERALGLMQQYGGGEIEGVYTDVNDTVPAAVIEMPVDFPDRIVGVEYGAEAVIEALEKVGCQVEVDGSELDVTPPSWRPDLDSPITLVEEVARLHGYGDLPSVLPPNVPAGRGLTRSQQLRRSVARTLAEQGLTEVLTYPFMAPERLDEMMVPAGDKRRRTVTLANPMAADLPLMRPRVLFTLVDAVKTNLGRGSADVAVFEVGRGYLAAEGGAAAPRLAVDAAPSADDLAALDAALPEQPRMVAGIMAGNRVPAGWNQVAQPWEWTDALAAVEDVAAACGIELSRKPDAYAPWHPGRAAAFSLPDGSGPFAGTVMAHAGELHPKVCETLGLPARSVAFQVILDPLLAAAEAAQVRAVPVLTQPLAKEDFAFVVAADVASVDLVQTVRAAAGELLEDARVFDVYAGEQVGEGKKSLAVSVRLRAADRTLDAEEILGVRKAVIAAAEKAHGAVLR